MFSIWLILLFSVFEHNFVQGVSCSFSLNVVHFPFSFLSFFASLLSYMTSQSIVLHILSLVETKKSVVILKEFFDLKEPSNEPIS